MKPTIQIPFEDKKLLNTSEVGALLGLGRVVVSRLVRDGKLPAALVGRGYLIRRSDLDEFLKECSQKRAPRKKAA